MWQCVNVFCKEMVMILKPDTTRAKIGWRKRAPLGYHERYVILDKCGSAAFLVPTSHPPHFPVVDKSCRFDCAGSLAAYRRAMQFGYSELADHAIRVAHAYGCDWARRYLIEDGIFKEPRRRLAVAYFINPLRLIITSNANVARRWVEGMPARSYDGNFGTDGESLWSYDHKIGYTDSHRNKFVLDYTARSNSFISRTTSKHVGYALKASGIPINPKTGRL